MTRPQFSSHADEIIAARAEWLAELARAANNTHAVTALPARHLSQDILVTPEQRKAYIAALQPKAEPAPPNVRFMARLCLALVALIAVVLAFIAVNGGGV